MEPEYRREKRKRDYPKSPGKKLEEKIYFGCGVILLSALGLLSYKAIDTLKKDLTETKIDLTTTRSSLGSITSEFKSLAAEYNLTKSKCDEIATEYARLDAEHNLYKINVSELCAMREKIKQSWATSELTKIIEDCGYHSNISAALGATEFASLYALVRREAETKRENIISDSGILNSGKVAKEIENRLNARQLTGVDAK